MEAQAVGNCVVEELHSREAFVALRTEWDALVAAVRDEPFFRHDFIRAWIDNFAPQSDLRIILLRDGQGRLEAALPLVERRTRVYGLPVRELASAANAHSCRSDLIARDPATAGPAVFEHLSRDRSWDLIRLIDIPDGGAAFSILESARQARFPTGVWESLRSPYVPLAGSPGSFEQLQQKLQSKFRANLRRRRRKLEERGAVTVERFDGGLDLEARLEEGFRLEQSGWKGERGTAMAQDAATRGFYRELAQVAEAQQWLTLFFLRLDGRPVAFHYGLTHGGRYFLLKPGYDESLRECSPGQLLLEEVLRDSTGRGQTEFDFLGPDMVWKRDWTSHVRPHSWIYLFRDNAMGRALCNAKFEWVPAAKAATQAMLDAKRQWSEKWQSRSAVKAQAPVVTDDPGKPQ